jgi:hypothetical protein
MKPVPLWILISSAEILPEPHSKDVCLRDCRNIPIKLVTERLQVLSPVFINYLPCLKMLRVDELSEAGVPK